MDITHKTAPVVKVAVGSDKTLGQKFVPEDRITRTLQLIGNQDLSEREERNIARKISADPREQILALYDEYRPRLFRYIRSMNLNRDQAEEVIQETFMRLTTHLLQGDDIDNVQGWIVRVAHNFAIDLLKKNDRDAIGTSASIFALENRVDPTLNPEEAYLQKEQIRRMEITLSTFNPQQRHCFYMRVQGFRYKDIGLALGISEQRAAFVLRQVAVRLAAICG